MSIEQMTSEEMLEIYNSQWIPDPRRMMLHLVTKDKVLASVTAKQVKEWQDRGFDWQRYLMEEVMKGVNNDIRTTDNRKNSRRP